MISSEVEAELDRLRLNGRGHPEPQKKKGKTMSNKRKNSGDIVEKIEIVALFSPFESCCLIAKVRSEQLRTFYKNHYYGKVVKTRSIFALAREKKLVPPLYRLETVHNTQKVAFYHCIAWGKYFLENGYKLLNDPEFLSYVDELKPEAAEVYASIDPLTLAEICCPEKQLFADFGQRKTSPSPKGKRKVTIELSTAEYETLCSKANAFNMSLPAYCKTQSLKGRVIHVEEQVFQDLQKHNELLTAIQNVLTQSLIEFYRCGQISKNYIASIDKLLRKMQTLQESFAQLHKKLLRLLRERS